MSGGEQCTSISHSLHGETNAHGHLQTWRRSQGRAAANRDDAADHHDKFSDHRDDAAEQRDAEAARRDEYARQMTEVLEGRLSGIRRQLLDHLQCIENITCEPIGRADSTPSGSGRPRVDAAEHHRLVNSVRTRITALIDELHNEIRIFGDERRAAARDRLGSARDRRAAAGDRSHSALYRASSARDRSQAAIEREQADPFDLPEGPSSWKSLTELAQAVSDSKQRNEASLARLLQGRCEVTPGLPPPARTPTFPTRASDS